MSKRNLTDTVESAKERTRSKHTTGKKRTEYKTFSVHIKFVTFKLMASNNVKQNIHDMHNGGVGIV